MGQPKDRPTPLLDHCDGADADDRTAIMAAFIRMWRQQSRRTVTDLHVREFILAVYSVARHSTAGIQWSHDEIADRLCCTVATARKAVQRAAHEFGIVAITEERYLRGGQAANRYRIEWAAVRSINSGRVTRRDIGMDSDRRPGVVAQQAVVATRHPPVVAQHAGAVAQQPYKESTSIYTSTSTSTHSLTDLAIASGTSPDVADPWAVVVSALEARHMSAIPEAITAAQGRELTAKDVHDLVERWERLRAHQPGVTVGWLYRWITGQSRPPEPTEAAPGPRRQQSLTSESTRREMVRSRIVKAGRLAGHSEAEIGEAIAKAMARRGGPAVVQ